MKLLWEIDENDIKAVKSFIKENNNAFVSQRISRNISHQNIQLDKNAIIKGIM